MPTSPTATSPSAQSPTDIHSSSATPTATDAPSASNSDANDAVNSSAAGESGAGEEEEEEEQRGRSPTVDNRDEMDPRNMSPRRDSEELHQLGAEAKARLEAQARTLQSGLLALLERVDQVREEHDNLEHENRFLQEYIGSLMATSRITGTSRSRNAGSRLR